MDQEDGGSYAFVRFSADANGHGWGVWKFDGALSDKIFGRAQAQYMNRVV